MKAIILCAGLGTRLRPYTFNNPKVMLPIKGKPLLQYHIENLKEFGIKEIGINLHYLPEKIINYFGDGKKFGVNIHYSNEKKMRGTSGAVRQFKKWLKGEDFFVIYGDNYSHFNYDKILEYFQSKANSLGIICLLKSDKLKGKGLVKLNRAGKITFFVEKPKNPEDYNTNFTNAGTYCFKNEILKYIPNQLPSDFSIDVFPNILKKGLSLYGHHLKNNFFYDIGTTFVYESVK